MTTTTESRAVPMTRSWARNSGNGQTRTTPISRETKKTDR